MILSSKNMLPFNFPTNFIGSFGPAVGAIVVTLIISGKTGFKELMRKILLFSVHYSYYLFALLFIVFVTVISILIYMLLIDQKIEIKGIESWIEFILYFIIILFLGGPLGEEVGWRGFLQPKLHEKFNPFLASIFIFVIWMIWHIPLFWLEGAEQQGSSIISFAILVLCMSFLFTWLYLNTKGSLMLALLFHTSINFVSAYVNPIVLPFTETSVEHTYITSITIVFITFLLVWLSRKKLLKKANF